MSNKPTSFRLDVEAKHALRYLKKNTVGGFNLSEFLNEAIVEKAEKEGFVDSLEYYEMLLEFKDLYDDGPYDPALED